MLCRVQPAIQLPLYISILLTTLFQSSKLSTSIAYILIMCFFVPRTVFQRILNDETASPEARAAAQQQIDAITNTLKLLTRHLPPLKRSKPATMKFLAASRSSVQRSGA